MAKPLKWEQIEDDRGVSRKRVALTSAADLPPQLAARLADAVQQMKAQGRGPRISIGLGILIIIVGCVFVIVMGLIAPVMIGVAFMVLMVAAVIIWLLAPPTERRKHEQSILDTLLAECHCASCGYSLRGLAAEQDGCTVCPECQAAWKLPESALGVSRESHASPAIADPGSRNWHWLDLVIPGRRRILSFRDARGRIVELIDPTLVRPPPAWSELDPATRRGLQLRLWIRSMHWRVLGLAMVGLVAAPQFVRGTLPLYGTVGPLIAVVWIYLYYTIALTFILPPRWGREKIVILFLRRGVCPSCAALLAGQRAGTDGVLVCPACRAAWQMNEAIA